MLLAFRHFAPFSDSNGSGDTAGETLAPLAVDVLEVDHGVTTDIFRFGVIEVADFSPMFSSFLRTTRLRLVPPGKLVASEL